MHVDLMRDRCVSFPDIDRKKEVRTIRVWHCKFKSLQVLSEFESLEEVVIATFPDSSLDFLASLKRLRYLSILHMPKISNLDALRRLECIEVLSLSTSPTWDAKGKCTIVDSLEPISKLKSLKHLELFGVCSVDKSLVVLEQCKNLSTARFSGYSKDEIERFYRITGVLNKFNPNPSFLVAS